jgi:hypothetical protein
MQPKVVAIRKRTQIAKTNRVMFSWVAGVSVVFGVALVGAIFLTQMLLFNERVLKEKATTISVLNTDNNNIQALESQVRVLNTNQALIDSETDSDSEAVQVILDALPSDANSLALGASLQEKLLSGVDGLILETLQVDPVVGIESLDNSNLVLDASSTLNDTQNQITFSFSISGTEAVLQQTLKNLESSIRTIEIISFKIENQGDSRLLTAQARAFYEPARVVQLKDKTVK